MGPPGRNGTPTTIRRQIVLFGGSAGSALADTWTWDGQDWTEQAPSTSPPARFHATMAYAAVQHEAVLFGGLQLAQAGPPQNLTDTWTWDGTSWTQAVNGPTPPRLVSAGMAADEQRGDVLLVGIAVCAAGAAHCIGGGTVTWLWDGSRWSEKDPTASAPAAVAGITYDGTRRTVVLFGGSSCSTTGCDAWAWDGGSWHKIKPW
jgi:hypothetical protein